MILTETKDYFLLGRIEDKRELELTKEAMQKASSVFPKSVSHNRWPYLIQKDDRRIEIPQITRNGKKELSYSQSTNAMILFSLIASAGLSAKNCPLTPKSRPLNPFGFQDPENSKLFRNIWEELIKRTKNEIKNKGKATYSSTFGVDDPFTLTWIIEIERSGVFEKTNSFGSSNNLIDIARKRLKSVFTLEHFRNNLIELYISPGRRTSSVRWLNWPSGTRISIDHSFVALRFVQLYKSLLLIGKRIRYPFWVAKYFENVIHEQLSKYEIMDGGFDAAELVFALEGSLHLNSSLSNSLLDRIFEVINESQKRNPYWRPIKPIIATPQGHVLFPLSVETASSLLRCCSLIEEHYKNPDFFTENVELFKRYTGWLRSRAIEGKAAGIDFFGWHSEHVHQLRGIHVWETSNVLLYLQYYSSMLEKHIAKKSLESANLVMDYPWEDENETSPLTYWKKERKLIEPFKSISNHKLKPYEYAQEHIIKPRESFNPKENIEPAYSVVLYGPPGTGKTDFAEEICKALKWPLVTISPSDFLHGGESELEARAKKIFEVLEDQYQTIILFDEIDRIILDRASEDYTKQGDIFQFMTPSMLTKLRNLRKKSRSIFIIATNYKERIDPAAIRKGRIDEHLLMPPPSKESRIEFFIQYVPKKVKKVNGKNIRLPNINKIKSDLSDPIGKTALYTFQELKTLLDEVINDGGQNKNSYSQILQRLNNVLDTVGISNEKIVSYEQRFGQEKKFQRPYQEFLSLVYLKLEANMSLDSQEKKLIDEVFCELSGCTKENWTTMDRDDRKNAFTKKTEKMLADINELTKFIAKEYSF